MKSNRISLSILLLCTALSISNIHGMKKIRSTVPAHQIIKSLGYIQDTLESTDRNIKKYYPRKFNKNIAMKKVQKNIDGISGIIKRERNGAIKTILQQIRRALIEIKKILRTKKSDLIEKAPDLTKINTKHIEYKLKVAIDKLKEPYRRLIIVFGDTYCN